MRSPFNSRCFIPTAVILVCAATSALSAACASARVEGKGLAPSPPSFHAPAIGTGAQSLWSKRPGGLIADLDVSADGRSILVASLPDRERDGGQKQYVLRKLGRDGAVRWARVLESSVRAQAISADGSRAVISTYDDQVVAIDSRGPGGKLAQDAWKVAATCRPLLLEKARLVLCFHDDDAAPQVAFDLFAWVDGRRVASFTMPAGADVLALRVSADEKHVVVGMTGGRVELVSAATARSVWSAVGAGEMVDVSVADAKDGAHPRVGVLRQSGLIELLGDQGKVIANGKPAYNAVQAVISPRGDAIVAYANNTKSGQVVDCFELGGTPPSGPAIATLVHRWGKGDPFAAKYPSTLQWAGSQVLVGLEDQGDGARHTHGLSIRASDGAILSNIVVPVDEGGSGYTRGYGDRGHVLAVGGDEGTLTAFALEAKPQ